MKYFAVHMDIDSNLKLDEEEGQIINILGEKCALRKEPINVWLLTHLESGYLLSGWRNKKETIADAKRIMTEKKSNGRIELLK